MTSSAADHDRSSSLDLAGAVRVIGSAAKSMGLEAPGFRSPPRLVGVDRSIRRRRSPSGGTSAVVSVRVKGRPWVAVLADMIEGVVAANRLAAPESDRVRTELWSLLEASLDATSTDSRRVA
ncbi:MAG: hypothetical protein O2925_01470 [Actinomycetota bacterium]|nr:hypothetical protein [Actinomycetota bacterium]MDA3027441.1 hypothetical protein [Actinomycetota bacterium]